jgi:hypothetical protein
MSSRFTLVAGTLLAALAVHPLAAQQSGGSAMRDTAGAKPTLKTPASSSVDQRASSDSALADLGRAITALAMSVQTAVQETAKNPEVRRAAVQTAGTAVSLAQRALEENTGEIERLLAQASKQLSVLEAKQKAKATPPEKR